MTLYNRRYFTRQHFEIKTNSLAVKKKSLLDEDEFEVPFEQIHNKIRIQTISNSNHIVIAISAYLFGILFLFGTLSDASPIFFVIGLLFTITSIFSRKKIITISTYTEPIELYFNNGNKEDIKQFASEIITAANLFLFNRYCKVDKALPHEPQLEKIQFLLEREIINDAEFEQLKNQLLSRENTSSIGFSR